MDLIENITKFVSASLTDFYNDRYQDAMQSKFCS